MPALTRTARGLSRPTPAEARVIAALSGLGAELALSMPAHSSEALRAKLMASAADPTFMAAGAAHVAGAHAFGGSGAAGAKASAVTAKISSAIAPLVAPVAAGVIATNLAVAGVFVANHQNAAPPAPTVIAQDAANRAQDAAKNALAGQIAVLGALGHTYDQLTPAQLTAWLQQWSRQTSTLLGQLTSKADVARFLQLAQTEVNRLSPLLPAPAVAGVTKFLTVVGAVSASPTPTALPTQIATPGPGPTPTGSTSVPTPAPTALPVPTPTVPVPGLPTPAITGPVKIGPF